MADLQDTSGSIEQRFFELATDVLLVTDLDGIVLRANPAAERLTERSNDQVVGSPVWELLPAADVDRLRRRFTEQVAARSAAPRAIRHRVERPSGDVRFCESTVAVDGSSPLVHVVTRDITARDARDAERIVQAIDDSPIGMAVVAADGRLRRVNAALCEMLGTPESALLERSAFSLAEDQAAAERWTAEKRSQGLLSAFELEARLRHASGTTVVAHVTATLVGGAGSEGANAYLCLFHDVTARIAAQTALEHSKAQLAEAQQVARLGSWEWLPKTDAVAWSDELYRIHGLRPEPGARQTLADHLARAHPDDRERLARMIESAAADRGAFAIDHRILRPDGQERMIQARGEVTVDEHGETIAVHGICQDVTESRRVEDARRAAEQLFRRAFDDAPIGMALIDLEGRWLRLNRAVARMLGHTEPEMRARTLRDFDHPEDSELDGPLIRELLAGRRRSYAVEKRLVHADGRVLHVLGHVSLMHGDGERPLYFLVQLVDISERRRAEAERRAGEQRLQAVVDNAPALIYVKDLDQRLLLVNRRWQELFGVSAATAQGRTSAEVLPATAVAALREDLYERVIETGEPVEASLTLTAAGGEERRFLAVKFPLLDGEGRISAICSIATDVTDRERADEQRLELEQRLAQAQRLESVGQLAGGVAHDFNNLLTVIMSCVGFAEQELDADSPVLEDVHEIGRAAERAAALTRQLLMFSRREVVTPELVDVGALVRDLESLLDRTLSERVELRISCADDVPHVLADRSRIEQVLVNLAVNARDAMPDGGVLSIDLAREDESLLVTVTDEGEGMSAEVADRAFEPFYTTKAPGDGTGLGLATVHGIVTDSGGEISLRSEPGRGTVVRFTLPAAGASADPAQPDEPPRTLPAARARVLVVEDQDPVRRQAVRILERQGYEVRSAAGGAEALEHWEPVDVLLTDVVMPGLSGHELAQRAAGLNPGLRVVLMSGHTEDVVVLDGARDGDFTFVQKPFTGDTLLAAVADALEAGPAQLTGPRAASA